MAVELRFFLMSMFVFIPAVFFSGCYPSDEANISFFSRPQGVTVTAEEYILQPPDEIQIIAAKVPELHEKQQQIRPDGMVSFEGIGEVKAAGKTPDELAKAVYEKAVMLYTLTGENPVSVEVTSFRSSFYYVMGQVNYKGPMVCTGRDTLLTALARSRPTVLAWKERILVIRPAENPQKTAKIFEVNFKAMMEKGDFSKNVLLEQGDVVYVPPTVLATVGLTVEEIVRPIARAFSTVNVVQGPQAAGY